MYGMSLAPAPIAIFHFAVAIAIAATSAIVHLFASSSPAIIEPMPFWAVKPQNLPLRLPSSLPPVHS